MVDKTSIILVVDDSKENIDALRGTLEDKYTVRVAVNGEMALKAIEQLRPDLVLLDVVMPGMDGFEVLRIMKSNTANESIPVIFITSEFDSYSEARGLLLGAVDYITKPYNPDIVSIKVKNQLINKMHRDDLERLVEQRTHELLASRDAIIMGMSLLAEGHSSETGEHIQRIKKYTSTLAYKLLEVHSDIITKEEVDRIILVSPLHDVGKVCVSDTILLKPAALTYDEFEEMKRHTIYGSNILRETEKLMQSHTDVLETAVEISEGHHEKYDGTGYPYGLKGDDIPLSARIVALADVFDALSSKRVYKRAFTRAEVIETILVGDGRTMPSHFDPRVLEVFKMIVDKI